MQIEEHQDLLLDSDPDLTAAVDLGGEELAVAQGDQPKAGDDPVDLERVAVLGCGQRRRPCVDRGLTGEQSGQVVDREVGADALDPRTADADVNDIDVGPEPGDLTGAQRGEPELSPRHHQVPRGRDDPVQLDRATSPPILGRQHVLFPAGSGPSSFGGRSPAPVGATAAPLLADPQAAGRTAPPGPV